MNAVLGAIATAGVLGVTHALEPDHVAGISSLTGRYADARLSALVGVCFAAGHVALVVAWLAGAAFLLDRGVLTAIDPIGTVGAGLVLATLGASMAVRGARLVVDDHVHAHDDTVHAHPHLHKPIPGTGSPDSHAHAHGAREYLQTGLVGALFTLSPPLSMLAFVTAVLPSVGVPAIGLTVLAYAVAITTVMGLLGAGVGSLFARVAEHPRTRGVLSLLAGILAVSLAGILLAGVLPVVP